MEQSLALGALALPAIAVAGSSIRRWSSAHSARRSMSNYLDSVLADLATLSIKPTGALGTKRVIRTDRLVPADVHVDVAASPAADHTVELYETDAEIVSSIAGFYEKGLEAGDPVVLVATPAHRQAVESILARRGHDLRAARYTALDAQETLDSLCVEGAVDTDLFETVVGRLVRRLVAQGRPVHIYGEMVGLLWGDGDVGGAMRLETLWNDLRSEVPFALHCGYGLSARDDRHALEALCRLHGDTVGPRAPADRLGKPPLASATTT